MSVSLDMLLSCFMYFAIFSCFISLCMYIYVMYVVLFLSFFMSAFISLRTCYSPLWLFSELRGLASTTS